MNFRCTVQGTSDYRDSSRDTVMITARHSCVRKESFSSFCLDLQCSGLSR